jgi:hypothetical protein
MEKNMAKNIIPFIQEPDFERQYNESKDYLKHKYHDHPTMLKNIPSFDDWLFQTYGISNNQNLNIPNGKRVI